MPTSREPLPPYSPFATAIAFAGLLGAGVAIFYSLVVRAFACEDGDCSSGGTALLVIACAGVLPVIAMLVESRRPMGHPWYWFAAGAIVYAFWGIVFISLAG